MNVLVIYVYLSPLLVEYFGVQAVFLLRTKEESVHRYQDAYNLLEMIASLICFSHNILVHEHWSKVKSSWPRSTFS